MCHLRVFRFAVFYHVFAGGVVIICRVLFVSLAIFFRLCTCDSRAFRFEFLPRFSSCIVYFVLFFPFDTCVWWCVAKCLSKQ